MLNRKLFLIVPTVVLPLIVCSDSRLQESIRVLAQADRFAMLYNWPKSSPLYVEAETHFKKSGDNRNALLARFGYFWTTADTSANSDFLEELSTYLRNPAVRDDPRLLLRALIAQAFLTRNTNELKARESWEKILDVARAIGDRSWEARAKAEIGQILYMDGNVQAATAQFRDALLSQYVRLDWAAAIYYTSMVGNGLVEAGRPETGLQYCNLVLRLATVVREEGFPFLAYQGKARALFALNRNGEAEQILNEAIAHARQDKNNFALAQLLVVAGTAAASRDREKSIEYLREATDVSRANGFDHVYAWSTWGLAKAYRDLGNLNDAEVLASSAIEAMRLLEDRYHLPEHLTLLAGIESKKDEIERADELYTEATDLIDALLVNVNTTQLKSSLIATLSEAYVGHFELVANNLSDPGKAYAIIESARGRSLADTLRGETESLSSADEITLDAQKRISSIQLALLHETSKQQRQSLLDTLFATEQLLRPVKKVDLNMGSAARSHKPVPLPTLQSSLRPDETLLEYVLGETASYCMRITRTRADVIKLPASRKRIENLIDEYLSAVRSRRAEGNIGNDLYSVLLRPAIAGIEKNVRLIIVPDGKLHLLPIDGLQDDQGRYVVESNVVTYAPSATALYLLRSAGSSEHAQRNFLGIGDVPYPGSSVVNANVTGRSPAKGNDGPALFELKAPNLSELPGSGEEVISAARILKGDTHLLLAKNATEAAFKSLPVSDFRIIHFAVHGIADAAFPDRAALVLGSSPVSGEDGLLQVREIRDLSLRADLVILSACESGKGKLLGEEGIASLERAFLLAGAKAVVASLWTTDDIYTIAVMKRFYQHLMEGDDKGAALRQAKLDLLKDFGEQALPAYWAGLTLVGDPSSVIFR